MNQRQFVRNIGRIPRLLFHIRRCTEAGQTERVEGFKKELERRKAEMKLADLQEKSEAHPDGYEFKNYGEVLKTLLKLKLQHYPNKDYETMQAMHDEAAIGMPTGAAEFTPK